MTAVRITASTVRNAKPRKAPYFIWDSELKGFGLRIAPSGAVTFCVQYRALGGRNAPTRRMSLARAGAITVAEARAIAQKALARAMLGQDPAAEKQADRAAERFGPFAERYLEQHSRPKKKASTSRDDERYVRNYLGPSFNSMRVADIKIAHVTRFHAGLKAKPVTANRCLALLSHMMTMAERWGDRPPSSNPCRGVVRYKERRVQRYLSMEELDRLGRALDKARADGENRTAIEIIRLLALTGARRGEIEKLRWNEVDLARGRLFLRDSKTDEKTIHLSTQAALILESLPRQSDSPYVFPAAWGENHFQGLSKVWRSVRERAGLCDVRLHDLRHSFASMAALQGASLLKIGAALGHRNQSTTMRYAHLACDPVRRVVETASSEIGRFLVSR